MYVQTSDSLIAFLRLPEIQHFIDSNSFEELYRAVRPNLVKEDISALTSLLLEAGIDPLEYMTCIPRYYLFGTGIYTFRVPKHIDIIQEQAFGKCYYLQEVVLEGNLQGIYSEAFFQCSNIQRIVLGSNVLHIGDRAFGNIPRGIDIIYKGSMRELDNIFISKSAFPVGATVKCTDGVVRKDTLRGIWKEVI